MQTPVTPTELSIGILKTDSLAQILGCSSFTIEERARKGELPGLKFGDEGWVFPIQATLQVLNQKALEEAESRRNGDKRKAVAVLKETRRKNGPPVLPSLQAVR